MKNQKKILIIKFGALGDVLLASGQVRAIIERHRGEEITILTEPNMVPLLKTMISYGKKYNKTKINFLQAVRKHYWCWPRLIITLWLRNYQRVYDLQTSGHTARLYRWLLVKPLWNGLVKNIWQDKNKQRQKLHAVERFDQQLSYAGIRHVPPPDVDYLQGKKFPFFRKKFFMLVIGGSSTKIRKKQILPLAMYIAVAKFLEEKNIFSVIVGGKHPIEKLRAEQFVRAVPSCINLVGKTTLGDIAEIARHAHGVVGNDTGVTHLAALARNMTERAKRKKNKKTIPIIVVITPPAQPQVVRPMGPLKKSIHIIYRANPDVIRLQDITKLLPKSFR